MATSSENTEVEVLKHVEISPTKTGKLSRHQKYQQLMLLCKELSDIISSDLPIQDYQMMVQFIKGVTCTVCNGKSIVVKELSEMLGNNSQMEDGKKDPRFSLSQDSGNVILDDMEYDPPECFSD